MRGAVGRQFGCAMFAAVLGSCGASSTGVEADGSVIGDSSVPSGEVTTTLDAVTTAPMSTTGPTTVAPSTVAPVVDPEWDSITIDPADYATRSEGGVAEFARLDTDVFWLPLRLPAWLDGADIGVFAWANEFWMSYDVNATIPYSEGRTQEFGSDINFHYSSLIDRGRPHSRLPKTIQGAVREYGTQETYTNSYEGGPCGDVVMLDWYEGNRHFTIMFTPGPGECSKGMQSVEDAVAFADALVPCKVVGDKLEC